MRIELAQYKRNINENLKKISTNIIEIENKIIKTKKLQATFIHTTKIDKM